MLGWFETFVNSSLKIFVKTGGYRVEQIKPLVAVFYRGPSSLIEIQYACDICRRLDTGLTILVNDDKQATNLLTTALFSGAKEGELTDMHEELWLKIVRRIKAEFASLVSGQIEVAASEPFLINLSQKRVGDFEQPVILVDGKNPILFAKSVTVVIPFEESSVLSRGAGEVMFPIGKGASGRWAVKNGLPMIKMILPDAPILFWHTTWQNQRIESEDPSLHICEEVRDNISYVEGLARQLDMKFRTVVEMRRDVVEGLARCALREHCVMVVMARGLHTGSGRYGDQLIKRSCPVPIMMIKLEGTPSW